MRQIFFFFCLITAAIAAAKQTVCLNMIVKNESRIIEECLTSIKPMIDYWVIVDTGSTDGTQDLIRKTMEGVPGKLYERPWVNFEVNRNEALSFARGHGDYIMMIDADEKVVFDTGGRFPELKLDSYFITVRESGADYQRLFLIKENLPWRWKGVLHETLLCSSGYTSDLLNKVGLLSNTLNGARSSDPQKYLKDAAVLEKALIDDPNNSRYVFYLAQSYYNAGEFQKSKEQYQKRSEMGGWDEEVYWAIYRVAQIQHFIDKDLKAANETYQKAFQYRPRRAEPLFHLANNYLQMGDQLAAYALAKFALSIQEPDDHVFVEHWIYRQGLLLTLAQAAYQLKFLEETKQLCKKISEIPNLDPALKANMEENVRVLSQPLKTKD